ncbi:TetR/AcrR family transcriptional regulator [Pseudemcibacter aquimaris]|uniref:TetR/AcrR family transcriptional regulator n=1 Tax=Pseudemcibacter aquimaris TaxID=2857064 RepID=UPI0020125C35|nr:hypothetical protein [Pseudemcibacter aquimaris]MCC3859855.1 hypothetical protein [Pseudemcibacter aquimaris]WDU57187.1 hypothetical protein KW060_08250 [Pseudemcibacter aquimaris]
MTQNVTPLRSSDFEESDNIKNFPNRDWIEAGIKLLREHGPHVLSIDEICTLTKKNEQEFNQTFEDIDSFYSAIFDYWYEKETLKYIDMMDEIGGDAETALYTMAKITHDIDKQDEIAIRNLALRCPEACNALDRVDRTRLDVAAGLFKEMGFSDKDSMIRAKILYTASIGTEYTSISASLDQKLEMLKLLLEKN